MNPAAVRQAADREAKSKAIGFGYETKSADRPLIQSARAEFLATILEIRPQAVFNLLVTCHLTFTQLIEQSEGVEELIEQEKKCGEMQTNIS